MRIAQNEKRARLQL